MFILSRLKGKLVSLEALSHENDRGQHVVETSALKAEINIYS